MKILLCSVIIFISLSSYSYCLSEDDKMPVEQWKAYKEKHGKSYSDEEDAKRFEIFKESLSTINEHNKKFEKGEVTYSMGLNQFTDWTSDERSRMHGLRQPEKK